MNNFQQLNLPPELLQAIDKLGFTTPTEIQEKTIPVLIKGVKDFIGLAQTGTGKTAAYGLPLISIINNKINKPQGLIICPTRELCLQIQNDLTKYGEFIEGFKAVAVYGGSSISTQIFQLKRNCQIVVATPGRLIDLIDRKAIDLTIVKYVVLDEADEMLQMGFEEDVISILKHTTNREQFWLFSATMPTQIKKVIKNFMQQPYEIQVGTVNSVNKNISHQYCITSSAHRYETLKRILDFNPGIYGIIFARTKVMTQEITEKLIFEGYNIDSLHGDLSQVQRDKVMNQFRKKQLQLIVATDVAARGIDVENLTHVINYELPDELEVYTHRSGRTGRAGKEGICFTIVHSKELYKIKQIERTNKISFHKTDIPTGSDICRKQFFNFIEQFINTKVEEDVISPYMSLLEEKFASFDKQDLLKRLLSVEFQRLLKYYENAIDLNKPERESKNFQDRKEYGRRDNDRKEYGRRDNDRKEYG
ncbi:MAG: DEAD/DEAH box helicase, partial [Sediminibacterium sp.]|nr:DEAD/DEAH box helicase [Sediminibacterium sp.]